MEPQWSYNEDDATNEIYDILIDTMVKDRFDLYIFYANATLKKFSCALSYQNTDLVLEEQPFMYTVEALFKSQGGQAGGKE